MLIIEGAVCVSGGEDVDMGVLCTVDSIFL